MIHLTRLNHSPFVLNADLIETIETTPDTVITLLNSQKVVVREPLGEVLNRIVAYRNRILPHLVSRGVACESVHAGEPPSPDSA
jgi:flagellar protein FlbD